MSPDFGWPKGESPLEWCVGEWKKWPVLFSHFGFFLSVVTDPPPLPP
jgi:hypothetical protein